MKLATIMFTVMSVCQSVSRADPGFPVGGGANPPGGANI